MVARKVPTKLSARAVKSLVSGDIVIGTVTNGSVSISSDPMIHLDTNSANAEAERLAKLKPGVDYVVFQVRGSVSVNGISWK